MSPSVVSGGLRRFAPLALVLASVVVALGAYLQALNYPFVSDDAVFITENHKLAMLPFAELWRVFTEPYNAAFEFLPLRDLSFWLDMALSGQTPATFRLDNIILYLLCLPLVYATTLALWRYFRPQAAADAPWAAGIVTALFAIQPALVESVVWISGRKYVLPNLFSMLALWLAVNARREHGLSARYATAALVAFVAVMLSKSSYVAVAPIIAMLWIVFWLDIPAQQRRRSQLLWPLAILLLAAFLLLIFIASNKGYDTVPAYFGIEAITRSLAALGWLARLAGSPESRHFFYPVFEDPWLPAVVALGAAIFVAAIAGTVALFRKRSFEGFILAAFFLLCLPYLQLIPAKPPSLVADRYVALSAWLATLLIVSVMWRLRPALRTVVLLAIALPWLYQTIERPKDWRSFEALVDNDLLAYPGHYLPSFYKAISIQLRNGMFQDAAETAGSVKIPEVRNMLLSEIGANYAVYVDAPAAGKPDESISSLVNFGRVLKEPPEQTRWNAPMKYIWDEGDIALTNLWWLMAYRFPEDALVNYHAGLWLLDSHKYKDAVSYFRVAAGSLQLPENLRGTAYGSLGSALLNSGEAAAAEAPLRAALEQSPPNLRAYCLLSEVYKRTNRTSEAALAEANCRNQAANEETAR